MVSILTSYDSAVYRYRKVYIRMYDIDHAELENLIEELGKKETLVYIVDH